MKKCVGVLRFFSKIVGHFQLKSSIATWCNHKLRLKKPGYFCIFQDLYIRPSRIIFNWNLLFFSQIPSWRKKSRLEEFY